MTSILSFLETVTRDLVEGCRIQTPSGISLFTPDGVQSYNALWLRDFSYMAEYAGEFITDDEMEACIRFAMAHVREDGWMPDRVYSDGSAVYAAGEKGAPVGKANLDNTAFLVMTADTLLRRLKPERAGELFAQWYPALKKGLDLVPTDESGAVFNPPKVPHSPYGFTDTIGKTGRLFMESVICWRAYDMLDRLGSLTGTETGDCRKRAGQMAAGAQALFDGEEGCYLAAGEDCRQKDVWGNAYALSVGFPMEGREDAVAGWLTRHLPDYLYQGQVRHLLKGEYWDRLLIPVAPETYQNGAYWATASGWVAEAVAMKDPALARKILADACESFQNRGVFECVNLGYEKLDRYVVSAANLYGAAKKLLKE